MPASFALCDTYSPLRRALLHRPVEALADAEADAWGYARGRDGTAAGREFDAFVALLHAEGVDVDVDTTPVGVDAVYACDPLVPTPFGPIVGRMAKAGRRGENAAAAARLAALGVTPLASLDDGCVEGGDVLWLDAETVLVGVGHRSDHAGADALARILSPRGVRIRRVELPDRDGPSHCLHLRSLLNVLDRDLAVVDRPWLPTALLAELRRRGLQLLEAIGDELATQGNNLLVLSPRRVALVGGNPRTEALLRAAGVTVLTFPGQELCVLGTGGPTCLTFDARRGDAADETVESP